MLPEPPVKLPAYSESQEEAKHPGAMLGLIMGMYPAILIVGLLIAVGFMSIRNMSPTPTPVLKPTEIEAIPKAKFTPQSGEKEDNTPQ